MFQEYLLENIKVETTKTDLNWFLKTYVHFKCSGSISDAIIILTLDTKTKILKKEQSCCNDVCIQNEMYAVIELSISTVICF